MKKHIKIFAVLTLTAMVAGCGDGGKDNVPAIKLTATTAISELSAAHGHSVDIPFTDISSSPAADIQYRSSDNTGHSHVIALSKQQMIDLNNGMRLTLTSSAQSSGAAHTHVWNIQGGNVLYDKYCYNCHTNDKRNHTPMNVSFNSGQIDAVKSPAVAPLSSTAAAVPDPGYTAPAK